METWTPFEQAVNSGRRQKLALLAGFGATRPFAQAVLLDELVAGMSPCAPAPM